ncbi:MAG TPA: winged helix DNA-binding domain-containing protein [Acidimicrobiia bacterium]|nr:winged helix DNA-binding domain-containing protein [Acidimicrobiia bacterium]
MVDVDRARVLGFRTTRHHLDRRLAADALTEAAGTAGIQESSPGTAGISFHARVRGVTSDRLQSALTVDKTLVTVWAMRGAPYIVPTDEIAIFTTGSLPTGEESLRTYFGGWAKALRDIGSSLEDLVARAAEVAAQVLDGRTLVVDEFRHAIAGHMPEIRGLKPPSGAHARLPEPLFRLLGQMGLACIVDARRMTDAIIARTDQWLGSTSTSIGEDQARAELLRRFLRCYGPATAKAFAEWTTRSVSDAQSVFSDIETDLVDDDSGERLLAEDLRALKARRKPSGVRLVPAHDPFLQQRDRERLLPDQKKRKLLWRPVGAPGLLLVDGKAAGVWKSSRDGEILNVTVEPFATISKSVRRMVSDEAEAIAPFRGAERAVVSFAD